MYEANIAHVPDNGVTVGEGRAPSAILELVLLRQLATQPTNSHNMLTQPLYTTYNIRHTNHARLTLIMEESDSPQSV